MKKVLFIFGLLFVSNILLATSSLFRDANELYDHQKYKDAIILYDSIQQEGLESSELFYNMGNAYYKLKKWPQSILYYERTLKNNPNYEDAIHNLSLAQLKIIDKIEPIPQLFYQKWWKNIYTLTSVNIWALLCIIFLWLGLILFIITKLTKPFLNKNYFLIFVLCSIFSFSLSHSEHQQNVNTKHAIIYSASVVIKSAPSYTSTDIFTLHAGSKVQITDQIGNWIHIQLANGNKGWMIKENCQEI